MADEPRIDDEDWLIVHLNGFASGREHERKQIVAWLKADAKLCDCMAHSESECACGAWCEWKTVPMHQIIEAIEAGGHLR